MTEVAKATGEQAAAVEEITASVAGVGRLVQQTAKEAVYSTAATEEVTASIDQITVAISAAANSVQKISLEMGKFTSSGGWIMGAFLVEEEAMEHPVDIPEVRGSRTHSSRSRMSGAEQVVEFVIGNEQFPLIFLICGR